MAILSGELFVSSIVVVVFFEWGSGVSLNFGGYTLLFFSSSSTKNRESGRQVLRVENVI